MDRKCLGRQQHVGGVWAEVGTWGVPWVERKVCLEPDAGARCTDCECTRCP